MNRTISVKCQNTLHCGHENVFSESDLVSEVLIKDEDGNVIKEHSPVEIDANTFVKCSECGYPINCAHAVISD